MVPKKNRFNLEKLDESNPMTRLLKEEEKRAEPLLVPSVEVHPVKIKYSVTDGTNDQQQQQASNNGFVLVSQETTVFEALQGLMKVAAPDTTSSCKRIWSRRDTSGTKAGDGYELVDLDLLDGKLLRAPDREEEEEEERRLPRRNIGKWLEGHFAAAGESCIECDVLVEVRHLNSSWSRDSLELENRIQVGDFVDAQDATGKWYEAIVREVADDTVSVHYFGWASKWNGTIRKKKDSNVEAGIAVSFKNLPCVFASSNTFLGLNLMIT